jgi:hypothetical protein
MSLSSFFILVGILLVALGISYYHYLYKAKSKNKTIVLLAFLRFCSVFTLLLLLWNPYISTTKYSLEKTPLPIIIDNSSSLTELKADDQARVIYNKLKESKELTKTFAVQFFQVDTACSPLNELTFKGKQSRLDEAGKQLKLLYRNQKFPTIFMSDGNQTAGNDFVYSFEQNNVIKIAVFDVTPSLTEDQFGPYNLSSGLSFLRCINSFYTTNRKIYGDNLELVFKAKRRDIPEHFSEYINSRKELFSLRGVRGAKWSDNMYEIIASSNFVICMVGTSPALVAKELKIPVVYLHVGDVLTFEPPVDNGIIVLNSLEELIRNFQRILQ